LLTDPNGMSNPYREPSIYRHGGHDGWSAGSSDILLKGTP
jgi:hypothetical protein